MDAFIIGSEMRGLTWLRDENDAFPFVDALKTLAGECRLILGPGTGITYAADWSEYFGYQPADGSGNVYFHLDPLWADPAISAVGIDNYMPLSDWRGTIENAQQDDVRSPYDADAMEKSVTSGEGYEWYYASAADREAGVRSPISSGDRGDHWLYRYKDLEGWWSSQHFDRRGGVATSVASDWVPGSKPIWFTELGAPAVDGAANQPNVFPDPKSSENALPYHSRGGRDDLAQRRFLEAHFKHWAAQSNGMVPMDRIYLWTWDARPQPAFPSRQDVWSDGGNWHLGHWLTGRLGGVAADDLMHALAADGGVSGIDASQADGVIDGLLLDGDQTARGVIEALSDLWNLSATQNGDVLSIASADWSLQPGTIDENELVQSGDDTVLAHERTDDEELPSRLDLAFADVFSSYEAASVSAFRGDVGIGTENVSLSISLSEGMAQSHAADLLRSRWASRDSVSFALPPAWEALAASNPILIDGREYSISEIERGEAISVSARSVDRLALAPAVSQAVTTAKFSPPVTSGVPDVSYLDLPRLPGTTASVFGAVSIKRWRGGFGLYASAGTDGFSRRAIASRNAVCGRLTSALGPGIAWRWLPEETLTVELVQGELSSQSDLEVLNGANVVAIETAAGWELVQFGSAELIGENSYELTRLLRGQNGTEVQMKEGAPVGARFVVLDEALVSLALEEAERGAQLNWRAVGSGELLSSQSVVTEQFAGGLRGLQPLSPVHLKLSNHVFAWTRRDRLDADNWDQLDIPMSERTESYLLRIVDAGSETTFHEQTVSSPFFDASGLTPLPASVRLEVAQISAVTGLGDFASRTFAN